MAAYTVRNVSKSMKYIIVEIMGSVYQHRQKRKIGLKQVQWFVHFSHFKLTAPPPR